MEISTSEFPHPYTNEQCQVKLYQVLGAFFEQDIAKKELKKALSLGVAIHILSNGSTRNNRHISTVCQQSLRSLEKLCQPVGPPIGPPDVYTTMEPDFSENVDDEMETATHNVPDDSEAAEQLDCAADPSGDDADSEKTVEWKTSQKINIQEVKIIKKSTSMEVSQCESGEKMHNEENISCKETVEANVTDQSIAVENTDLPQKVSDTEEAIVKEEFLSRSEIQPEEVEDNSQMKNSESTVSNVPNELPSNSDVKQEKEQAVEVSTPVDIRLEPQQTEVLASDTIESANKNVAAKEDECEEGPPLKKSRVDEGFPNDSDLKREQLSQEEIDDVFEEDDSFVDVVRDDY
nr:uncharacterized protein LOC111501884 [Leptinotarsa decemlineata]